MAKVNGGGAGGAGIVQNYAGTDPELAAGYSVTYVTPESLMIYCQSRLQDLDGQMNAAFAEQQRTIQAEKALGELTPMFDALQQGGFNPNDPNSHAGRDVIGSLQTEINKLGANTPAGQALIKLRDEIATRMDTSGTLKAKLDDGSAWKTNWDNDQQFINDIGGTPGSPISGDPEVKAWSDELKGIQTSLNQSSELMMINLQQIMSQRQTALQLTTNLIQSIGDETKQIANNVGK